MHQSIIFQIVKKELFPIISYDIGHVKCRIRSGLTIKIVKILINKTPFRNRNIFATNLFEKVRLINPNSICQNYIIFEGGGAFYSKILR